MRILVVDDNAEARDLLARLFRLSGYEAIGAKSCAEAVKFCEQEQFPIGLIDIQLPDGSGIDLMKRLSAQNGFRGIAVSGYDLRESDAYRAAGFSGRVLKPIDFGKLMKLIQELSPVGNVE